LIGIGDNMPWNTTLIRCVMYLFVGLAEEGAVKVEYGELLNPQRKRGG
jgi:hypothetical protein